MRARQLEVFTAVMRAGTVTAAARMLNISQPALSQILLHTEDELGFPLFDRVKGRLRPTPEAYELLPEAERLFAGLEGIRRKSADLRMGHAGLVRIAASAPPSMAILPQAIAAFRKQHPDILLRSHIAPIATIIAMLRDGDASLGLVLDDRLPPDIAAENVGRTRLVCLLPDGHPLCDRAELGLDDLKAEDVISYRANTRPGEELLHFMRESGVALNCAIEIDVSIAAVGYVQAGLGVGIVDALLPWQQFAGLHVRPLRNSPSLPLSVLTSKARSLSRAEDMLRIHIREACAQSLPG